MKMTLILGMFPSFMTMTAVYLMMTQFNLINQQWGLILIYSAGAPMGYLTQKGFFDTIPSSIDEAARIDGASPRQIMYKIKLPLLQPTILYLVVVITIWTLEVFEPIYVMTDGGPLNSTRSVIFTAYQAAFKDGRLGYGSAISMLLFFLIFVITLVQLRLGRTKWEY